MTSASSRTTSATATPGTPFTTPARRVGASKGCGDNSDGQNAQLRGHWARFKKYDIAADEYRESTRWATKYGIGRAGGVPLPHSHAPVLQREIDDWDDGIAPKGWRPFHR
jgi:hypothetical protein